MLDVNVVRERYFNWILEQITTPEIRDEYDKLFRVLDDIEFTWINEYDENRAADGIDLRSKFGEYMGYSYYIWHDALDRPCSLLEMMAALAIRCEDSIMGDEDFGDRTDVWFWNMVSTMGLEDETDDNIDELYVRGRCLRVLKRDYAPDGFGGFFYIPGRNDMREVEIWYQLNYWLNEKFN